MREILFRGKRITDGEWLYGPLVTGLFVSTVPPGAGWRWRADTHIFDPDTYDDYDNFGDFDDYDCAVDPETVGQYTGYEIGGKKLFEGDIVKLDYEPAWDEETGEYRYSQTAWGTIVFENGRFLFKEYRGVHTINTCIERDLFVWELHKMYEGTWLKNEPDKRVSRAKHAEIIGNIHDNPGLLGD